jgi:hypothetical protein
MTFYKFFLASFSVVLIGCGESQNKNSFEYKVMSCTIKTDKCTHDETIKFKVKKYDNTVYVNIYDTDGTASGNNFLSNCEVYDKSNWKCKYTSMVAGEIVESSESILNASKLGFYSKYEKVKK